MMLSALDSKIANTKPALDLIGRISLALLFVLAGLNKIQYYEGNAQYLASSGLPAELLPLVIAFELLGGLLLMLGYQTRLIALAFGGFSLITAVLYHNNLADQMQFLMFFKNIVMAGGFFVLAANGAGRFSLDAKRA